MMSIGIAIFFLCSYNLCSRKVRSCIKPGPILVSGVSNKNLNQLWNDTRFLKLNLRDDLQLQDHQFKQLHHRARSEAPVHHPFEIWILRNNGVTSNNASKSDTTAVSTVMIFTCSPSDRTNF
jgi:hypothetical protein